VYKRGLENDDRINGCNKKTLKKIKKNLDKINLFMIQ
jgi:hypothetical protein